MRAAITAAVMEFRLVTRNSLALAAFAALTVMLSGLGAPRLHLAFEDRGDPRPRQFALTGQIAGTCAGLIISWSQR